MAVVEHCLARAGGNPQGVVVVVGIGKGACILHKQVLQARASPSWPARFSRLEVGGGGSELGARLDVAPPPLARTAVLPSESHARYQRKSPPATHLVRPSGGKSGAGRAIKFLQGYFCVGLAYTLPSFICGT